MNTLLFPGVVRTAGLLDVVVMLEIYMRVHNLLRHVRKDIVHLATTENFRVIGVNNKIASEATECCTLVDLSCDILALPDQGPPCDESTYGQLVLNLACSSSHHYQHVICAGQCLAWQRLLSRAARGSERDPFFVGLVVCKICA